MSLFLNIVAIQVNALLKSMFPGSKIVFEEFWRTFQVVAQCFASSMSLKWVPLRISLSFGKRKKSVGAKSGLYGCMVSEGALPFEILEGHLAQPSKNALVHCHDETGPRHEVSLSVF